MSDVAISAQLSSDGNIDGLSDLGRSMGGALSMALAAARLRGDDKLAQLLEFAKITDNQGELALELALPEAYLKQHLDRACSDILNPPEPEYIEIEEFDEDEEDWGPPEEDEEYEPEDEELGDSDDRGPPEEDEEVELSPAD
jgi:hypothetical protein